jgi:protein-L-isoaspartate(D-aspartate) O-methyltransferase
MSDVWPSRPTDLCVLAAYVDSAILQDMPAKLLRGASFLFLQRATVMVDDNAHLRINMVMQQLVKRGIEDPRVLQAMRDTPRHLFVPARHRTMAYEDMPLPIGHEQTISQPLMVAMMTAALQLHGHERVLEIGTGSGYQAAILSHLASVVFSIERIPELAAQARTTLAQAGIMNVHVLVGDGSLGLPEHGPYDAIVVTAASPKIPPALVDQLHLGGRLVIPVGKRSEQTLMRLTATNDRPHIERLGGCRFVPLIGQQGWLRSERAETEGS